jgi:hypothetical protein
MRKGLECQGEFEGDGLRGFANCFAAWLKAQAAVQNQYAFGERETKEEASASFKGTAVNRQRFVEQGEGENLRCGECDVLAEDFRAFENDRRRGDVPAGVQGEAGEKADLLAGECAG